jgi:hypothetical protein
MSWKAVAVPLVAVLALLALAGACGGSDEDIFEDILDELGITPTDEVETPAPGEPDTSNGEDAEDTPTDPDLSNGGVLGSGRLVAGGVPLPFDVTECSIRMPGVSEMEGVGEIDGSPFVVSIDLRSPGDQMGVQYMTGSDSWLRFGDTHWIGGFLSEWVAVDLILEDGFFSVAGAGSLMPTQGGEEVEASVEASCSP